MATVTGTDGAEVLDGTIESDAIYGYGGNDTLRGFSGDDYFYIGGNNFGVDRYEGGDGADRIRLSADIAVSNLQLTAANVISTEELDFYVYDITGTGGNDTFDISGITTTSSYDTIYMLDGDDSFVGYIGTDRIDGGSGNDTLNGGGGSDGITGGSGNDTLIGGSGDDYFYIGGSEAGLDRFDGGEGADRIRLSADLIVSNLQLTAANVTSTELLDFYVYDITGTGGNDTFNISAITTTSSYDTIYLLDGDDSFVGYIGTDRIDGGSGNDTLNGGGGSDGITGGSGNDTLIGGSGDDYFYIGGSEAGLDRFNGGDGADRIRLSADLIVSNLQLTSTYLTSTEMLDFYVYDIVGTGGNDRFNISGITTTSSYDTIYMLDGADSFVGYIGTDRIDGGSGNDTLDGGGGSDGITGGSGNDRLIGGSGDDYFYIGGTDFGQDTYLGGTGADRIRLTADIAVSVLNLSAARVAGTEMLDFYVYDISGTGGADNFDLSGITTTSSYDTIFMLDGNDTFRGHIGNDYVDAGAGNDRLIGGAGDDRLTGGSGRDTVDYSAATGGVRVDLRLTASQAIGGGQGNDTLTTIEHVTGSSRNDLITGNASANTLLGAGGNDTLAGGLGTDVLNGGFGLDTVSYSTASGGVAVRLAVTTAQNVGGGQGLDRLIGIENLTGSRFADRLDGNAAANLLNGLGGNDKLLGGSGNDQLFGGEGADQLTGGLGNDRLQGQGGNDILTGNGGADSFRFDLSDGTDRLADWQDGIDTIVLERGSWLGVRYDDYSDLTIIQSGGNAIVEFGGTKIVVVGVQAGSLTAADFDFV